MIRFNNGEVDLSLRMFAWLVFMAVVAPLAVAGLNVWWTERTVRNEIHQHNVQVCRSLNDSGEHRLFAEMGCARIIGVP